MMKFRAITVTMVAMVILLWTSASRAELTIEITQRLTGATPIAVVPFGVAGAVPVDVAAVIDSDLGRSGRFAPIARADMPAQPHDSSEMNYEQWRAQGKPYVVVGKLRGLTDGRYEVQFRLLDVFKGNQITGHVITDRDLRGVAHQIADLIYEKLTGERGAFNTRIVYVTVENKGPRKGIYQLQVADIDGFSPQTIMSSAQPILSPAWSPDGRKIAYVSFEKRRAEVYIQDISTSHREKVSAFPGMNNAPAWSPDGKKLALTLSKDGNAEIYVLDLNSRALERVTQNSAIDTEAVWAPNGQSLVFTSDRGGGVQLYQYFFATQRVKRLTFDGKYNARASFSRDGRKLAYVHQEGGGYRIAVLDLGDGTSQSLTGTRLDESPSFAPNGGMILYATEERGRGVLSAVSVDGRVRQRLASLQTEVREPAWSPTY